MAYADAFAVATALAHDAVILTGDTEILDAGGPVAGRRPPFVSCVTPAPPVPVVSDAVR